MAAKLNLKCGDCDGRGYTEENYVLDRQCKHCEGTGKYVGIKLAWRVTPCPDCGGTHFIVNEHGESARCDRCTYEVPCRTCGGTGEVHLPRTKRVVCQTCNGTGNQAATMVNPLGQAMVNALQRTNLSAVLDRMATPVNIGQYVD